MTPIPQPCQLLISCAARLSTSRGMVAGPAEKLKGRIVSLDVENAKSFKGLRMHAQNFKTHHA